ESFARYRLRERATRMKDEILGDYAWDVWDIQDSSREVGDPWLEFLGLFDSDDVIWVGEPEQSGSSRFAGCFRQAWEWKDGFSGPPGHFTCPGTFAKGSYSRRNDNVVGRPYLVVEGDCLLGIPKTPEEKLANKNACGAVFRWMRE